MAKIDNELNQIKNAVYGKDVRGSIHDGIDKINKETEVATDKSEQAYDVMESIINDGFDNAALESNFEQKLDDKIADLQPEWTQFKDKTNQQLAQTDTRNFKNSLINHKRVKRRIGWIDDDGHLGVYTKLAPIVRDYNIKMSAAIVTNYAHGFPINGLPPHHPTYMTYEQMVELYDEGIMEYLPHTHTHDTDNRLTDMTTPEMREELETNIKIFKQLGWNHRHLVYPFGAQNETVQNVVRQYFDSAFDISRGVIGGFFNQYKINRVSLDTDSIATIKGYIDEAVDTDSDIVLFSHVDQYGGLDLDKTKEIIEYALSRGFEFSFIEDIMNNRSHLAQFDGTTINSLGKIDSKTIGVYQNGHMDYTPNAPITDFKEGTVTRIKVTQGNNADYGVILDTRSDWTLYGYIEVYRDSNDDLFSFRKLYDVNHNQKYISRWLKNDDEWGRWEAEGNIMYLNTDNFAEPRKPSEYSNLKAHVEKVRNVDASNYNLDEGGGMIYTTLDNEEAYATQLYIPSRGSVSNSPIKIRHTQGNIDEWGSWLSLPLSDRRYTRTINATINANSSTETYLDTSDTLKDAFYINKPNQTAPNGITIDTYCVQDGRLTIKITNSTNSDISLSDFVVEVRKLLF